MEPQHWEERVIHAADVDIFVLAGAVFLKRVKAIIHDESMQNKQDWKDT